MGDDEWKKVKLKDITSKIGSGATPRGGREAYIDEGISLIRSLNVFDFRFEYDNLAHINEKQAKKLDNVEVQKGDILLNITGASVARCCMVPNKVLPARVNQHVSLIRINKESICNHFVFYSLISSPYKGKLLNLAHGGATRQALTKTKIQNFKIFIPKDITEQQKIATILSNYDDLIENNTRRIELLEEMAKLIYREWFVNFRFPGHEDVEMVYNEELDKEIPEGWGVEELGDIVDVIKGLSYKGKHKGHGDATLINLKCVKRQGGFRYDGIVNYAGKYKKRHVVNEGDIIIAVTDMTQDRAIIARPARIPHLREDNLIISMDLVKIVPEVDLDKDWIYALLLYSRFGNKIKKFANGTNVLHLRSKPILDFKFVTPPNELIKKFLKMYSPMLSIKDKYHLQNKLLQQTHDLLLPRLVTGHIDVSDLDICISDDVVEVGT